MRLGYARPAEGLPTSEQEAALRAAGAERVYVDDVVTPRRPLPMLVEALRSLRSGDILMVTALHRLGRSKREALDAIDKARSKGADVELLAEDMAVTASALAFGRALAAADQAWGRERGGKGVGAAAKVPRRRGKPQSIEPDMMPLAETLWRSGKGTAAETAAQVGVSVATMYRIFGPRLARNE